MRKFRLLALPCCGLATMAVSAAPARATDLTTYGYGNARIAASPGPVGISVGAARRLHRSWRAKLPGAIDSQTLIANGVRVGRRSRNLVLLGTEHGVVAALDVSNGRVVWKRRIGFRRISPSCQASPDGIFGVTGTMVADKSAGRLYVVDARGLAWALRLDGGKVVHGWPVRVYPEGADFDWGALTLSRGRLYVPLASLCDQGRYYGGIKAIDVDRPERIRAWETTGGTRAWAGGIWGWGGVSVDAATGDVFAASGNSIGTSNEAEGDAEQVIRLTPNLKLLQHNYPLRPPFQIADRDFGTVPVLIRAPGCPLQTIVINKDGFLYRYAADALSQGPRQTIRVANSTKHTIPLYGMPALRPVHAQARASESVGAAGKPTARRNPDVCPQSTLPAVSQLAAELRCTGRGQRTDDCRGSPVHRKRHATASCAPIG